MGRIFIVDDEPAMVLMAQSVLEPAGWSVSSDNNPVAGLERIIAAPPDLVLLDIRMPGMDGLEVCRRLKSNPKTQNIPIIMVSTLSSEADVVVGLEMGADDYVVKPFRDRELQARVKSVLKRQQRSAAPAFVSIGPLRIDPSSFTAVLDGQQLELRPKEFQLLAFFMEMEGQVLTRSKISNAVWGHEHDPKMRTIDHHVDQLRKKLGACGVWIKGLRGIGYRFDVDTTPEPNAAA